MTVPLGRENPVVTGIAGLVNVPVSRIEHLIIVITYDTGVAMLHTACCNEHARGFLATLAATPPDVVDISRFTGSN